MPLLFWAFHATNYNSATVNSVKGLSQQYILTSMKEEQILLLPSECDISVSKLLGFKTFPIFWMESDSVSKKFGIEKSIGFGIG